MRAFIKLNLNRQPETFVLTDLWFADKDADLNQYPPDGYMCVSGLSCHSFSEGDYYETEWRGISIENDTTDDREINNAEELYELIEGKKVVDVSAHLDGKYINTDDYRALIKQVAFYNVNGEGFYLDKNQICYKPFIVND